jgi:hypothetical protein
MLTGMISFRVLPWIPWLSSWLHKHFQIAGAASGLVVSGVIPSGLRQQGGQFFHRGTRPATVTQFAAVCEYQKTAAVLQRVFDMQPPAPVSRLSSCF